MTFRTRISVALIQRRLAGPHASGVTGSTAGSIKVARVMIAFKKLAADLKRHLNNETVVARPPSAAYKIQKAWRRNKVAFAASAVSRR